MLGRTDESHVKKSGHEQGAQAEVSAEAEGDVPL